MRQMNKGTISELKVAMHYMENGWVPYVPMHHDTPSDLLVTKGSRTKRIQVKTVYDCAGILRCNLDESKGAKYSPETVDVMACVLGARLWLIPMEDIEGIQTLNFGRTDGSISKTRANFNHTKYEVST